MALSALTFVGAAVLCAQNPPLAASADAPAAELISPNSYEQYLSLNAPTAIASTEHYTAIADGKNIHVYDRAANVYREYAHPEDVSQIAFDKADNLYFLSELSLWKIPAADLTQPTLIEGIQCLNFTLYDNTLYYYATPKKIKCLSLSDGGVSEYALPYNLQSYSPLSFAKENLYCVCEVDNGYGIFEVNPNGYRHLTTFAEQLTSITITNNRFYAVTKFGDFKAYYLSNLQDGPITDTSLDKTDLGGYTAVCAYGDDVYAVQGSSVRLYSAEEKAFTDFEINAASASKHRLDGANELLLAENRLFIADDGNDRISVYNTATKNFETAINSTLPTPFLSSYGETLLVASSQEAALYNLADVGYGNELLRIPTTELDGNVVGATCVYDRYYLLTDAGYCYTLTQKSGTWGYSETQTLPYATAFTADVYGSLYVAYDDDLRRFTEKELTTPNANGTKILDGLPTTVKLAVDYETNLYTLANGVLTKYTPDNEGNYAQDATYVPSYGLVKDASPLVTAFTFGVEDEYAYFLYDGNYVVKSNELQIPIVNPIPVGEAANRVFGAENRNFTIVTVEQDAILTEFDLSALQDATEFPYVAFERCHTPMTALKIGEENGYAILAVPSGAVGYRTYLVLNSSCKELPATDYRHAYTQPYKTGTLTNAVSLYKFPYLSSLLTLTDIPRGATVTLLGEVKKLNHEYYEVSYKAENGETVTGFIPKNYVLLFDGSVPTNETVTYGNTEDDTDTVWRLAYILLGFGAIGILVDFLLLRKPKKNDESEQNN